MDAKSIARLAELQAKGANVDAAERQEIVSLIGQLQAYTHGAQVAASAAGVKLATTTQQTAFTNAVNILVFNIEYQLRYSGNVVLSNAVADLNTVAAEVGIAQHATPMDWYNALGNISGSLYSATQAGINAGRARNHWTKALAEYAVKAGEPVIAPFNVASFGPKEPKK